MLRRGFHNIHVLNRGNSNFIKYCLIFAGWKFVQGWRIVRYHSNLSNPTFGGALHSSSYVRSGAHRNLNGRIIIVAEWIVAISSVQDLYTVSIILIR